MMRKSAILRLTRTVIGLPSVAPMALDGAVPKKIHGAKAAVPEVSFKTCPMKAKITDASGKSVPVQDVVQQLHKALTRAREAHGSDRGVISAPMLGYNARIIVVHAGLDKQTLINPEVTLRSGQTIHAWAENGDSMVRVERSRSVAVKYTTIEGDDETWYAMPLEESELIQFHLDAFDGFSVADRVSPVRKASLGDEIKLPVDGCGDDLAVVPRKLFDEHRKSFMQLVEPVPRAKVCTGA